MHGHAHTHTHTHSHTHTLTLIHTSTHTHTPVHTHTHIYMHACRTQLIFLITYFLIMSIEEEKREGDVRKFAEGTVESQES